MYYYYHHCYHGVPGNKRQVKTATRQDKKTTTIKPQSQDQPTAHSPQQYVRNLVLKQVLVFKRKSSKLKVLQERTSEKKVSNPSDFRTKILHRGNEERKENETRRGQTKQEKRRDEIKRQDDKKTIQISASTNSVMQRPITILNFRRITQTKRGRTTFFSYLILDRDGLNFKTTCICTSSSRKLTRSFFRVRSV